MLKWPENDEAPGHFPRQDLEGQPPLHSGQGTEATTCASLLSSDRIGMFYWTAEGAITDANNYFLDMLGYPRADLEAGKLRWTEITPPEYAASDLKALHDFVETGAAPPYEKRFLRRDGSQVPVILTGGSHNPRRDSGYVLCCPLVASDARSGLDCCPDHSVDSIPDDEPTSDEGGASGRRLMGFATAPTLLVGLFALNALIGWITGVHLLASLGSQYIPMAPSTAVCFLLLSIALFARSRPAASLWVGRGATLAAALVFLFAVQIFAGILLDEAWNIERQILGELGSFGNVQLGRMAGLTATAFVLSSLTCMLLASRRRHLRNLAGLLSAGTMTLSAIVLLGYLYGAPLLYGGNVIPMALTTALAFFCLGFGMLVANSADFQPLHALAGMSTRAQLLRAFLPVAPLVFTLDAALYQFLPIENPALHGAVLLLLSTIVLGVVIVQLASQLAARLDRVDRKRRDAERSLRNLARRLQRQAGLLDLAPSAIVVRDMKRIIRFWNRGAEEVYGYSREYALGRSFVDLTQPEFGGPIEDIETRALEHGTWKGEVACRDAQGRRLIIESRWSVERGADSAPTAIMQVSNDITAKKQAEEHVLVQLRRNTLLNTIARAVGERQDLPSIFRVVLDHIEGHLPLDFSSLTLFEPGGASVALHVTGRDSEHIIEALQRPFSDLGAVGELVTPGCEQGEVVCWPDTSQEASSLAQRFALAGYSSLAFVPLIVASRNLGVLIAARRKANAFEQEEISFLTQLSEHVALAIQDAHLYQDLVGAYEELRKTQQAVLQQERLRALGQMASGITHDINNALSPIVGYADLLLGSEENLSEDGQKQLETILTAAQDIAATIARLRQFYKSPGESERMEQVQLNALLQQVVAFTKPRWRDACEEHGIVIEVELHPGESLPLVYGVDHELREAFVNLFINAFDAMPEGGVLSVSSRHHRDQVIVELRDTGTGMNEETRERCLEPFYTTKGDRGTGLGLGMVYGIMQRHRGEVDIESELGKGTLIRLAFPVADAAGDARSAADSLRFRRHLRILSVDDEPIVRQLLKEMLQKDEHIVEIAENGARALEKFEAATMAGTPFDLVITDLGMPEIGGRRVAQMIKQVSPETPVILLTGWGARLQLDEELPDGVDGVLSKPPRLEALRDKIARVLPDI